MTENVASGAITASIEHSTDIATAIVRDDQTNTNGNRSSRPSDEEIAGRSNDLQHKVDYLWYYTKFSSNSNVILPVHITQREC